MPIGYQPPSNPFLSRLGMEQPNPQSAASDILGMAAPVGMAAAEPGGFLARKLAAFLRRKSQAAQAQHQKLRTADAVYDAARAALPESSSYAPLLEDYSSLVGSIADETNRAIDRGADALDLWRLRNLPISETVRRSTGAKNLYEWYKQALQRGPYSGDLP